MLMLRDRGPEYGRTTRVQTCYCNCEPLSGCYALAHLLNKVVRGESHPLLSTCMKCLNSALCVHPSSRQALKLFVRAYRS
jgi:hypothetical protein